MVSVVVLAASLVVVVVVLTEMQKKLEAKVGIFQVVLPVRIKMPTIAVKKEVVPEKRTTAKLHLRHPRPSLYYLPPC